jgi:hypothetical protein
MDAEDQSHITGSGVEKPISSAARVLYERMQIKLLAKYALPDGLLAVALAIGASSTNPPSLPPGFAIASTDVN